MTEKQANELTSDLVQTLKSEIERLTLALKIKTQQYDALLAEHTRPSPPKAGT